MSKTSPHHSRMKTVGDNPCTFQFLGKFICEQNVRQLRLAVGSKRAVVFLSLKVVKVDYCPSMGFGGDVDYSSGGAAPNRIKK